VSEPLGFGIDEPPDRNGAFPRLTDEQRSRLRSIGEVRAVESGETLFRAGDETYDFFVVESGAVAIVQGYGHENRVIAVHGVHRFLGELNLLSGATAQLTAVVRDPGEVIQVPAGVLRRTLADDEELSNIILRAFISRRSILIEANAGFKVVGSGYSPDSRRIREFLNRNRIPYWWIDVERDDEADIVLKAL
jgi:thioredoxin reductase (NADPH)